MAQLSQRLGLDLPDSFTGHLEVLANLFQSMLFLTLEPKAHLQNLGLTVGEVLEQLVYLIAQGPVNHRVRRSHLIVVGDEIPQMGVILLTDGRLQGDRIQRDLLNLADLLLRHLHLFGQLFRVRIPSKLLKKLSGDPIHPVHSLDHVDRNADGPRLIGDGPGDGLADPPGGIGRELVTLLPGELLDRLHQSDVPFLNQVEKLESLVCVLLGDRNDQTKVRLHQSLLGRL